MAKRTNTARTERLRYLRDQNRNAAARVDRMVNDLKRTDPGPAYDHMEQALANDRAGIAEREREISRLEAEVDDR